MRGVVWWNNKKTYKNAIPNELFLLVATQLHEIPPGDSGPGIYIAWAQKEAAWFLRTGMINGQGLVNDGQNSGQPTWTYNKGVILAGMAELYHITGNKLYLATAATTHLISAGGGGGGGGGPARPATVAAVTGRCSIFVRYLGWLYAYDPTPAYKALLSTSLDSLWAQDQTPSGTFGLHWACPVAATTVTVEQDIAGTMALAATSIPLPGKQRQGPAAGSSW